MNIGKRWQLIGLGLFLSVMWFACWAATVVPGTAAVSGQWAIGNALAFLAGGAFSAAFVVQRNNH
jgi:hypothetical protein